MGSLCPRAGSDIAPPATSEIDEIDAIERKEEAKDSVIAEINIDKSLFEIDYESLHVVRRIGKPGGSGADVFVAEWKNLDVAFKVFRLSLFASRDDDEGGDSNQFNRFSEFEREYGATLHPPRVGIVTEYCKKGDLSSFLKSHPDVDLSERIRFLSEVSAAMEFLHAHDVIHRDLKPPNVLVDEADHAKLTDFGLSKHLVDDTASKTQHVGTSFFIAPEVVLSPHYTKSCDVFSFSMMAYQILTGDFSPFENPYNIEFKIAMDPNLRPTFSRLYRKGIPRLVDILTRGWSHEPGSRPEFEEISLVLGESISSGISTKTLDDLALISEELENDQHFVGVFEYSKNLTSYELSDTQFTSQYKSTAVEWLNQFVFRLTEGLEEFQFDEGYVKASELIYFVWDCESVSYQEFTSLPNYGSDAYLPVVLHPASETADLPESGHGEETPDAVVDVEKDTGRNRMLGNFSLESSGENITLTENHITLNSGSEDEQVFYVRWQNRCGFTFYRAESSCIEVAFWHDTDKHYSVFRCPYGCNSLKPVDLDGVSGLWTRRFNSLEVSDVAGATVTRQLGDYFKADEKVVVTEDAYTKPSKGQVDAIEWVNLLSFRRERSNGVSKFYTYDINSSGYHCFVNESASLRADFRAVNEVAGVHRVLGHFFFPDHSEHTLNVRLEYVETREGNFPILRWLSDFVFLFRGRFFHAYDEHYCAMWQPDKNCYMFALKHGNRAWELSPDVAVADRLTGPSAATEASQAQQETTRKDLIAPDGETTTGPNGETTSVESTSENVVAVPVTAPQEESPPDFVQTSEPSRSAPVIHIGNFTLLSRAAKLSQSTLKVGGDDELSITWLNQFVCYHDCADADWDPPQQRFYFWEEAHSQYQVVTNGRYEEHDLVAKSLVSPKESESAGRFFGEFVTPTGDPLLVKDESPPVEFEGMSWWGMWLNSLVLEFTPMSHDTCYLIFLPEKMTYLFLRTKRQDGVSMMPGIEGQVRSVVLEERRRE